MDAGGVFELVDGSVASLTPPYRRGLWGRRGERRSDGPPLGALLGQGAACDGLTQPFEQAFKTRHVLPQL